MHSERGVGRGLPCASQQHAIHAHRRCPPVIRFKASAAALHDTRFALYLTGHDETATRRPGRLSYCTSVVPAARPEPYPAGSSPRKAVGSTLKRVSLSYSVLRGTCRRSDALVTEPPHMRRHCSISERSNEATSCASE